MNLIKLENINKQFENHKVLDNINVEFLPKNTTVLVGPSGAGKSTLLRSLNLLERPESGKYLINGLTINFGKVLTNKTILHIRRETGMVFQNYNLFPHLSVIDNLTEGPVQVLKQKKYDAENEALQLLTKVGLEEKAHFYPNALSGGQQQRVAIARSLAMHPSYILLDEPTSALDPESELGVLKILLQLSREGQSLIIITHNMEFAKAVADKIVFLEDGKILFDGDPKIFFNRPNGRITDFLSAMTFNSKQYEK